MVKITRSRLLKRFPLALLLASMACTHSQPTGSSDTTTASAPAAATNYRDLNKNGRLDVYEDSTQPLEARVSDLLGQMTLEEKAGMMFINGTFINDDGTIEKTPETKGMAARLPAAAESINGKHMNHFNFWQVPGTQSLATGYNAIQKLAENTRLGIPVTIASDPRNHFSESIFSMEAGGFSQWCEPLGFAAIGDEALTRQFADIARQEYLAVGMREALHPQVDLATEPRWARIGGTFGEDAQLSARMAKAYILGFQGDALGPNSVACMTKHFSGGGPQKEGLDPHFEFQKGQVYPGNNFDYHLIPFEAAFEANTAAIMPYYGVPTGQTDEEVAFAFNKAIITGLLREKYKFDGVVCTDWGLISDANMGTTIWPARAWGVEQLSAEDRVKKVIDAGVDQFGGESVPELVVQLAKAGKLTEDRLDTSVRRLLRQKFQLGLFDNPYVDAEKAVEVLSTPAFKAAGEASQRRAMTLLKNDKNTLPLQPGKLKLYVKNVDPKVAAQYGTVVENPKEADMAIIRLKAPWYPVETKNPFALGFHHGDLDFKGKEKEEILQLLKTVPTIVDIYLDRPAVIPEISKNAKGLFADFGASDAAVLDVIFGKAKPEGNLPFELPSSMEAVRNQKEDVPYDSKDPLYKFGFGLRYK
ncbi:glycoside hydrolase family 3 C-terminal domain-containing protein [Pontibacter sp. E15-1]|uniref:glycoside hydrolase family 3 protein n=1 Tax=Pontibacter sp. E15-1 TaxID=2919918 RepID=UPI001F4FF63F|nr:glycoside hydrolase family 3 N-terminal domain-containing protein [Pontibacter sp. E15-1]MCJ8164066.1 glycoside hydrolase family 3 C-terminal domain-containing protein [Pontibacter sp. E15-1]